MKSAQENKLSMGYTVLETCKKNRSKWENLPAFVRAYDGLEEVISRIEEALEVQLTNTKGITENKRRVRKEMVEVGLSIAGAVHAFAETISDEELREEMDFSRSSLNAGRDSYVTQKCQLIHDRASVAIGNLGDYGVTAAKLQSFQAKIEEFSQKAPRPRMAMTDRSKATQEMESLFYSMDKVLYGVMDKLMESFRLDEQGFYIVYFNSRDVIEHGVKYTNLSGTVADLQTKAPIAKASVVIVLRREDGSVVTQTFSSKKDGSFAFEKIEAGEYEVTVEREGYVRGVEKSDIRRGKTIHLEVFLQKEPGR